MEVRDWVMIVSAIIVTVGWFVTGSINRRNETKKKQADHRLEMLKSFWPILFFLQKNSGGWEIKDTQRTVEFLKLIETARPQFLLYGYNDEIKQFEDFVKSFVGKEGQKITLIAEQMNSLCHLIRNRIRKELGLKRIDLP